MFDENIHGEFDRQDTDPRFESLKKLKEIRNALKSTLSAEDFKKAMENLTSVALLIRKNKPLQNETLEEELPSRSQPEDESENAQEEQEDLKVFLRVPLSPEEKKRIEVDYDLVREVYQAIEAWKMDLDNDLISKDGYLNLHQDLRARLTENERTVLGNLARNEFRQRFISVKDAYNAVRDIENTKEDKNQNYLMECVIKYNAELQKLFYFMETHMSGYVSSFKEQLPTIVSDKLLTEIIKNPQDRYMNVLINIIDNNGLWWDKELPNKKD